MEIIDWLWAMGDDGYYRESIRDFIGAHRQRRTTAAHVNELLQTVYLKNYLLFGPKNFIHIWNLEQYFYIFHKHGTHATV
mgnify:FL=1